MWNFAALDTSSTINRWSYSRTGVIPKASSIATKTLCPVIRTPSNFSPPPHAPRHTHSLSCSCAPLMHIASSPKSHVIPPGAHSSTARKPQNINDLISSPETLSRELRAKLLRLRSQGTADHTPPGGRRGACGAIAVRLRRSWAAGPGQVKSCGVV